MKIKLQFNFFLLLILMISISNVVHSGETSSSRYLEQISVASITVLCSNRLFLGHASFEKNECIDLLTDFSKKCSKIIRPIMPNLHEAEIIKFRSIGELYEMCLKANLFETRKTEP